MSIGRLNSFGNFQLLENDFAQLIVETSKRLVSRSRRGAERARVNSDALPLREDRARCAQKRLDPQKADYVIEENGELVEFGDRP